MSNLFWCMFQSSFLWLGYLRTDTQGYIGIRKWLLSWHEAEVVPTLIPREEISNRGNSLADYVISWIQFTLRMKYGKKTEMDPMKYWTFILFCFTTKSVTLSKFIWIWHLSEKSNIPTTERTLSDGSTKFSKQLSPFAITHCFSVSKYNQNTTWSEWWNEDMSKEENIAFRIN